MSRSVDLFIDSSLPIEALAEHLRARTGAELSPTTDRDRWWMVDGSLSAELYEHSYVDDGELWLSRYRYVLSTHMPFGVSLLDSTEVLGMRHLAQTLHAPPDLSVLLVLDLQYRLPAAGEDDGEGGEMAPAGHGEGWGAAAPTVAPAVVAAEPGSRSATAGFGDGEPA